MVEPMTYESLAAEVLQAQGNSIIDFKTTEEKERIRRIEDEIRKLSNIYLDLRDSIISFKGNNSKEIVSRIKTEQPNTGLRPSELRKTNASLIRESKCELIQNALRIVCDRLGAQTASVFLFSKGGVLERAGLYGFDRNGKPLDNSWFAQENYEVGESFTGMAAKPKPGSKYGEIQYTQNLDNGELKVKNRQEYISKIGSLNCAIAIPLNGRNRTYGVLRVVNKVKKNPVTGKITPSQDSFTRDDVKLLLFLATYIANTLSNFRRDIQTEIFKYQSRLLIQPPYDIETSAKELYQEVVDLLVQNPETAFNAGILRSKDGKSSTLEIEAVSMIPGLDDNRNNSPRKSIDDNFLWFVVENKQPLILQDIQNEQTLKRFTNKDWIRRNKFKSFGCFPLISKDEVVGTLSLYIGYNYEFYADSIDFLQGIADLIAAFIMQLKLETQKKELVESLGFIPRKNKPSLNKSTLSRFYALANQWKTETERISSVNLKLMHPAYQQIIGLGEAAIPLILNELSKQPDHWFWALRAITGDNPVEGENQGKIEYMRKAWLRWGLQRDYDLEYTLSTSGEIESRQLM